MQIARNVRGAVELFEKVGIGSRSAAKQNSFNCRTWTGQAAGVGGTGDVRRESSGVSPGEGQCL